MVCNEQCLKLFGLDQAKQTPITKEFNIVGETIRRGDIQIEHAHLTKLNKDFCPSTSDLGSESDSGLGSVRTSKKESDSQKTVSEPESCAPNELLHAEPESTICTVTRADSMGTLAQDCYSLDQFDDEFISIFDGHASETLTDLVMQEFSKMQTIDVFQLKSDFEKFERVGGRPVHKPRGNTRVATTVPQMPIKTATTTEQQTSSQTIAKTSTESQNPVQKREKKMRKKRKMIRQKVEGESSTSSSESDVVQQKPKRKTQQPAEQPTPAAAAAAVNNNQATSESSK
jgi:hypothetical protein